MPLITVGEGAREGNNDLNAQVSKNVLESQLCSVPENRGFVLSVMSLTSILVDLWRGAPHFDQLIQDRGSGGHSYCLLGKWHPNIVEAGQQPS
jgi:hypothetical protein